MRATSVASSNRTLSVCALVVCATSLVLATAQAQQNTHLTADTACACKLTLTRVLSFANDLFAIDDHEPRVTVDRRGRFLISGQSGTSIGLYGADGKFIRKLGSEGSESGQLRAVSAILIGDGDSVHVFDRRLGRHFVYDPDFTHFVRQTEMPARFGDVAFVRDRQLVVSGAIPTRQNAGQPLHVVNSQGDIERSFGRDDPTLIAANNDQQQMFRSIVTGRDSGYWIAPATSYSIEWWNPSLTRKRRFTRDVEWFPPIDPSAEFVSPLVQRPQTQLRYLWQDRAGLIFANIGLAASDWRQLATEVDDKTPVIPSRDFYKYVDTIIEVIDPQSIKVLTSLRSPGILGQVRNAPYVWSVKIGAAPTDVTLDVFRMDYIRQ